MADTTYPIGDAEFIDQSLNFALEIRSAGSGKQKLDRVALVLELLHSAQGHFLAFARLKHTHQSEPGHARMTPEAGSGGTRRLSNGDMTVQMAGSLGRQVGKEIAQH